MLDATTPLAPADFEGALDDVRRRVRTALDAGPSPHLEGLRYEDCIETRAQYLVSIGLWGAVPVLLLVFLITRGPIFWGAFAAVVAAATYAGAAFVRIRDGRARLYRDGVVAPAALVWASEPSLDPEAESLHPAVFVATFDDPLAADPHGLVALADHLSTAAGVANALGGDALLAPRTAVPTSIAGNDRTFLIRVGINRYDFPANRFDRRVVFLLAREGAAGPRDAIFIPSIFWGETGTAWTAAFPIESAIEAPDGTSDDEDDDDDPGEDDGAGAMWSSEPPSENPAFESLCDAVRRNYQAIRTEFPPPGFHEDDDRWGFWEPVLFLFAVLWAMPLAIVAWFVSPWPVFAVTALVATASVLVAFRCKSRAERLDRALFSEGLIVPAALVQANDDLFDPEGEEDLPGAVLVSFDPYYTRYPAALVRLASSVFSWKHTPFDRLPPDARRIGWDLRTELVGLPPRPVPPAVGGRPDTWLVDVHFRRDALPKRWIERRIFFVLARRDAPQPAQLVPTELWLDDESDRITASITDA